VTQKGVLALLRWRIEDQLRGEKADGRLVLDKRAAGARPCQ
jgi:hypothetical protein